MYLVVMKLILIVNLDMLYRMVSKKRKVVYDILINLLVS